MGGILRRIGIVIACVIGGAVVGTMVAVVFGVVKGLLGGGTMDFSSAPVFGIGWFGAIGAIIGAVMGRDDAKHASRAGDVAAWIVAAAAAVGCISILIAS